VKGGSSHTNGGDRIAKLKERFRRAVSKVVRRPMTIIGPAETKAKQKTLL